MREAWDADRGRWVTVREAARRAGVSPGGVRYWIAAGRLPARSAPGGYLLDPADLDRLLTARRAADGVGIRVATLRQWAGAGD